MEKKRNRSTVFLNNADALVLQHDDEAEIKEILAENAFITAEELQQKIDEAVE